MKRKLIKPLTDGLATGFFLQLAVGPVFFYILGITLDSHYANSLAAVAAVTLADFIFILLSLAGVGKLLENPKAKTRFGLLSASVLLIFGLMILQKALSGLAPDMVGNRPASMDWTLVSSFVACFVLTISSPLTIVFWGSIFSAKAIEKGYRQKALALFGLGAGSATFLFLAPAMGLLSFYRTGIPPLVVQSLNVAVGVILVGYGLWRACQLLRHPTRKPQTDPAASAFQKKT